MTLCPRVSTGSRAHCGQHGRSLGAKRGPRRSQLPQTPSRLPTRLAGQSFTWQVGGAREVGTSDAVYFPFVRCNICFNKNDTPRSTPSRSKRQPPLVKKPTVHTADSLGTVNTFKPFRKVPSPGCSIRARGLLRNSHMPVHLMRPCAKTAK